MTARPYQIGDNVKLGNGVKVGYGAYIEDGAVIGDNVVVGHCAVIQLGSIIEENSQIGPGCVIGHPTKMEMQAWDFSASSSKVKDLIVKNPVTVIGRGSVIRSGSVVYRHVVAGKGVRTGHNVLIREHTTLGDEVIVGTRAVLDGYIQVGNRSMIQSQCYIAQSVRIGNGVFIAPGCLFFDNKKIVLGEGLNGAKVEDYVRIGGGSKILPGVTIGRCALVGAGSVVTRDIPEKAIAFGVPAEIKGFQSDDEIDAYVNAVMSWR